MFGGKLTSRQYGILLRMPENEREKARMDKENKEKNFYDSQI